MVNSGSKIAFLLVCVLMMVAFVAPALAVECNPGVSVGQWIKYGDYVVTTPAEAAISPNWSMIEVASFWKRTSSSLLLILLPSIAILGVFYKLKLQTRKLDRVSSDET